MTHAELVSKVRAVTNATVSSDTEFAQAIVRLVGEVCADAAEEIATEISWCMPEEAGGATMAAKAIRNLVGIE